MLQNGKMTTVSIKTQYEGVHCYPDAPAPVSYLRNRHRHIFGVHVTVQVFDDDREIEFIMLKHWVNEWIRVHANQDGVWEMGRLSCEQVCKGILKYLFDVLPYPATRYLSVTVDEDGENSATVAGNFLKVDFANVDV